MLLEEGKANNVMRWWKKILFVVREKEREWKEWRKRWWLS
jgi:hypothetical protein